MFLRLQFCRMIIDAEVYACERSLMSRDRRCASGRDHMCVDIRSTGDLL